MTKEHYYYCPVCGFVEPYSDFCERRQFIDLGDDIFIKTGIVNFFVHLDHVNYEKQVDVDDFRPDGHGFEPVCESLCIKGSDYCMLRKSYSQDAIDRLLSIYTRRNLRYIRSASHQINEY